MQLHKFLHIFHLSIHGQFHAPEDVGHHTRTDVVVVVECPSLHVVPTLATRFTDVVEQSGPTNPKMGLGRRAIGSRCSPAHVFEHFKRVVIIVLVSTSVACLHNVELAEFGQDEV